MVPLAPHRTTPAHRMARLATVGALVVGLASFATPADALSRPAPATLVKVTAVRASASDRAVAARKPVVLRRIAAIRTDLAAARAAAARSGLPARVVRTRVLALTRDQQTLGLAATRTVQARTLAQLQGAATLAESVAPPAPLSSTPVEDLAARADAVVTAVTDLRDRQDLLVERADVGESNGFDVAAWATPLRASVAPATEAGTLAAGAAQDMAATGVATAQDEADVVRAEELLGQAQGLVQDCLAAMAAANGS